MINNTQEVKINWKDLDVLRGLAALLMIVNHLGYKTLAPNLIDGSLAGNLVFIGSLAPLLFFFVTGVGYGIQSIKKKNASHWYVIFNKVIILVLADLLMHWSEGRWLGIDFLGFIGISSLVLEFIRNSRAPITYCIAGFASVSVIRYLLGSIIHALGYDRSWEWLGWIVGSTSIPGISYPFLPWLAYPLAGYLVGVAAMHYRHFIQTHRLRVILGLLVFGSFPAIAGIIMSRHGVSFFRWGTVALGFYIVSFATLSFCLATSLTICGSSGLKVYQNALSLRGIASLAVVPIHYFMIYIGVAIGIVNLDLFSFLMIIVAVCTASFLLARSVETLSQKIRQLPKQSVARFGLIGRFLLSANITLITSSNAFIAMPSRTFGQIVLCLLLVVSPINLQPRVNTEGRLLETIK